MLPRPTVAVLALVLAAGCSGGGDDVADDAPLVVVPNDVIGELVVRVSCVEPVTPVIADEWDGSTPVLVVTLTDESTGDESTGDDPTGDAATVSLVDVATTIDRPGTDDSWVWLDPLRYAEAAQGIAGALASTGAFDPQLLDRCVARLEAEMEALDQELYASTQTLTDAERRIDVSAPGTLYFANRYEFAIDESDPAVRAGLQISTDSLDGAATYDDMMRSNVDQAIAILQGS
jgi:ABC-type Zn2+ transport system substrate-binding protein/surface adhesin